LSALAPPRLTAIALAPDWQDAQAGRRTAFLRNLDRLCRAVAPFGPGAAVLLRAHGLEPAAWARLLDALELDLASLPLAVGVTAATVRDEAQAVAWSRDLLDRGISFVQVPEHAAATVHWRTVLDHGDAGRLAFGRSCHDKSGLAVALRAGADWAWVSPVFATPSKFGELPLGLEGLSELAQEHPGQVVALGGIGVECVPSVFRAGAAGVACLRAAWEPGCPALAAACLATSGRY
jgi:hypothetical protein